MMYPYYGSLAISRTYPRVCMVGYIDITGAFTLIPRGVGRRTL